MTYRSKWNCAVVLCGHVNGEFVTGVLFIGTQAGCAQAVKDCGYPAYVCYMRGFSKYELEFLQTGVVRKGKMTAWFNTHGSLLRVFNS